MLQQRTTGAVHHAHERILPYHVYSTAELRVEQHRQGNGLPQVVTGYDLDPIQATLIQSVPQELIRSVKQGDGEHRRHGFTTGLGLWFHSICCHPVKLKDLENLLCWK